MIVSDPVISAAIKAAIYPKEGQLGNYTPEEMRAFRSARVLGIERYIFTAGLDQTDPRHARLIVDTVTAEVFCRFGMRGNRLLYPREQIIHRAFEEAFLKAGIPLTAFDTAEEAYVLNCGLSVDDINRVIFLQK